MDIKLSDQGILKAETTEWKDKTTEGWGLSIIPMSDGEIILTEDDLRRALAQIETSK